MEKIPTAKKVYYTVTGCVLESHHNPDIEKAMIEFAKRHVEALLKEVIECTPTDPIDRSDVIECLKDCYPLSNIK